MLEMNKAGWVKSIPGRYGGYVLAKNSDEITMGEVIRYFEGMIAMISCVSVSSYEPCSQEGNVILEEFLNIRNLTAQILDKTTIASCLVKLLLQRRCFKRRVCWWFGYLKIDFVIFFFFVD